MPRKGRLPGHGVLRRPRYGGFAGAYQMSTGALDRAGRHLLRRRRSLRQSLIRNLAIAL